MQGNRNYLLYEDVQRDTSLRPLFNACATGVLDGSLHVSKTRAAAGYPSHPCFRVDGREILIGAALEYYLASLANGSLDNTSPPDNAFNYDKAVAFSEAMRKLCGFRWYVDSVLREWVNRVIREPFFYDETQSKNGYGARWVLKPGEPSWQLPEDYIRFACYVAICHAKYGASYDQVTTKRIFDFVAALGSDLPAKLKKHGSGELPKDVAGYKDEAVSCKANDVFATIKIALKDEDEGSYQKVLVFLCQLLEQGFPRSYSIDFKSPEKNYLPIKGLPKRGVHQLFANAVRYPSLHGRLEHYARLAMKEFEWYNNLEAEHCAMPGTFAVFALGLLGEKYHTLVCDYLALCDGEHQGVQGEFVLAYIEQYGFTDKGIELYDLLEQNIQHLPKKLIALRAKVK